MSKRMGGLGKLSDFGQTEQSAAPPAKVSAPPPQKVAVTEKLRTVNIKITNSQQEWLADTAQAVRDNNTESVPSAERVYPAHLIGVAIDLLKASEVDWGTVKNVEELRNLLAL